MYTHEKQEKFIELRAQGWSFSHIANELYVSKRTLVEWSRHFADDIKSFRSAGLELLQEKVTASREEQLDRLLRFQKDVEDELADRNLSRIPVEKLFQISCELRRQIKGMLQEPSQHDQPLSLGGDSQSPSALDTHTASSNGRLGLPRHSRNGHAKLTAPRSNSPTAEPMENPDGTADEPVPVLAQENGNSNGEKAAPKNGASSQNGKIDAVPVAPVTQISQQSASLQPSALVSPEQSNIAKPSALNPQPSTPNEAAQEVCLVCGADLPPLLPDGREPSHYCKCGQPLSLPGYNLREQCAQCGFLLPPHGYNAQRPSDTCPGCGATLPPLDPKANPPWLPPHMRAKLPQPKKP